MRPDAAVAAPYRTVVDVEVGRKRPLPAVVAGGEDAGQVLRGEVDHLLVAGGVDGLAALPLGAVERLRATVRAGDAAGFRQMMERGRDYLHTRPQPERELT